MPNTGFLVFAVGTGVVVIVVAVAVVLVVLFVTVSMRVGKGAVHSGVVRLGVTFLSRVSHRGRNRPTATSLLTGRGARKGPVA